MRRWTGTSIILIVTFVNIPADLMCLVGIVFFLSHCFHLMQANNRSSKPVLSSHNHSCSFSYYLFPLLMYLVRKLLSYFAVLCIMMFLLHDLHSKWTGFMCMYRGTSSNCSIPQNLDIVSEYFQTIFQL
jgi:hypothetical protein